MNLLDIAGAVVTIDAMGCQSKIVEKEADYLIGLKGNQGSLNNDVRLLFENKAQGTVFQNDEEHDKGHGRLETRRCTVTEDINWLKEKHPQWQNFRSVIDWTLD